MSIVSQYSAPSGWLLSLKKHNRQCGGCLSNQGLRLNNESARSSRTERASDEQSTLLV